MSDLVGVCQSCGSLHQVNGPCLTPLPGGSSQAAPVTLVSLQPTDSLAWWQSRCGQAEWERDEARLGLGAEQERADIAVAGLAACQHYADELDAAGHVVTAERNAARIETAEATARGDRYRDALWLLWQDPGGRPPELLAAITEARNELHAQAADDAAWLTRWSGQTAHDGDHAGGGPVG